jgi:hypothetical protein
LYNYNKRSTSIDDSCKKSRKWELKAHILGNLPKEYGEVITMLEGLQAGASMIEAYKKHIHSFWKRKFSSKEKVSNRSKPWPFLLRSSRAPVTLVVLSKAISPPAVGPSRARAAAARQAGSPKATPKLGSVTTARKKGISREIVQK